MSFRAPESGAGAGFLSLKPEESRPKANLLMRCFYHPEREAVGTCKSCGKGLCPECAADLQKGLACRGRCEPDVRAVIELVERNIKLGPASEKLIRAGKGSHLANALFYLVCGSVFFGYGAWGDRRMGFLMIIGGCLLVLGVFHVVAHLRMSRPGPKE